MRSFAFGVSFPCLLLAVCAAQAKDVPIYQEPGPNGSPAEEAQLLAKATALRQAGALLDFAAVRAQLERKHCELQLPAPHTTVRSGPALWRTARAAYVRIGHLYQCKTCDQWHLNLAGGYAIAAGGVVATCHHVVAPDDEQMKDGFLVCADDAGNVFPVHEVLASDAFTDVAIVRTGATAAVPLPLRVDVVPGENAFLFSDPMGSRGFFSRGIVNRFVEEVVEGTEASRVVVDVSTDWAPGSSGAGVLDECGNAIGHVSTISTHGEQDDAPPPTEPAGQAPFGHATFLVLHHATRAHDVLALVRTPKPAAAPAGEPPASEPR